MATKFSNFQTVTSPTAGTIIVGLDGGLNSQFTIGSIELQKLNGVLPVSKGGTGIGSLDDGNILIGNGANAVETLNAKGKGRLVVGRTTVPPSPVIGDSIGFIDVGTNGQVLTADDTVAEYGVTWADLPSVGDSPFTNKSGGATIDWDYATDGPNIKVTMTAGVENAIVVSDINEFPDGSSGFLILDPVNTTTYRLPSEGYGSAAGIESLITNGDPFTEGSNPVRMHWVYDGSTFWFDRDVNMVEPVYPPDIEFDSTNLIAFYHPDSFNQAVAGQVSASAAVPVLPSNSQIIGDLVIGSNVTNFTYEPKTATTPSFWSLGGSSNVISKTLPGSLSTIASVSFYIQQPAATGFCTLVDFYDGSGSFTETLYLTNRRFDIFSPSVNFSYPQLRDYTPDGGADLLNDWVFVSFSINNVSNEFILHVGTQSSLTWAQNNPPAVPGGTTDWDYSGVGDTVPVNAEGIYKEVATVTSISETTFDRFYYGNNPGGSESSRCHQGMLGVYGAILTDAQVDTNWTQSRGTYFIS